MGEYMEKFIKNLERIIYDNSSKKYGRYGLKKDNLLFGFGLLRLLDLGLKYSKKNSHIVPPGEMNPSFLKDVTVVNEEQDLHDKTIYVDNIFSLT